MTGAGFAKNSKGFWAKDGQEVAFQVEDPTSYTDYYADAQIIAQNLKPLGFNVSVNGVTPDQWNNDLSAGTFSSAIHWGAGGPTAYSQYDNWLDYNLVSGKTAAGDHGRWNDPATQQALADVRGGSDPGGAAVRDRHARQHRVHAGAGDPAALRRRLVRVQHEELRRLADAGELLHRPVAEPGQRRVRDPAPQAGRLETAARSGRRPSRAAGRDRPATDP